MEGYVSVTFDPVLIITPCTAQDLVAVLWHGWISGESTNWSLANFFSATRGVRQAAGERAKDAITE